MEKEKAENLGWYDLERLPRPIAPFTSLYLENLIRRAGFT
jgi:hypothetical protein